MKLRLSEIFRRNPYRPTRPKQRLMILGAAVLTALLLFAGLLAPHIRYIKHKLDMRHPPLPACAPGQTAGCLGGTQGVMLLPATPAPGPAASR